MVVRRTLVVVSCASFIVADATSRYNVSTAVDVAFILGSAFSTLAFSSLWLSSLHITLAMCDWIYTPCVESASWSAPEDAASFVSRFTFWWVTPTLRAASQISKASSGKSKLEEEDLPQLPRSDDPKMLFSSFASYMKRMGNVGGPSLIKLTFFSVQKSVFLYSLLSGYMFLTCMFLDPILLRRLLAGGSSVGIASSLFYVALLTLSMMIRVACMEVCYFASTRCLNNAGSALIHAVFRKAMVLPEDKIGTGKLQNLMATDADKVRKSSWLIWYFASLTFSIFSLPPTLYFLQDLVGSAAYIGMGTLILGGVISRYVGRITRPVVKRLQEARDVRSKLTKEFLRTVKAAKLQGWEEGWAKSIGAARKRELRVLKHVRLLDALNTLVGGLTSFAIPVSLFSWYTLYQGKELDATTTFTALAWINQMNWSITTIPTIFNVWSSLAPSAKRLAELFALEDGSNWLVDEKTEPKVSPKGEAITIEVADLAVGHDGKAVVSDLNLHVKQGELLVICGHVGSGKSTLLEVLSGAVAPISGRCECYARRRAYVSQKPFLLSETIRENILLASTMKRRGIQRAIADAELGLDLRALSKGDDTVVGESGVLLSGGQKTRVAIARAFYANASLMIFDDILAAVDAETGRRLFGTLQRAAFEENRTILLATHQVQYIAAGQVSRVLVIRDGTCTELTTEDEFDGLKRELNVDAPITPREEVIALPTSNQEEDEDESLHEESPSITLQECAAALRKSLMARRGHRVNDEFIETLVKQFIDSSDETESRRSGLINWRDFKLYLDNFGSQHMRAALFACVFIVAALQVSSNIWLTVWSDDEDRGSSSNATKLTGGLFLSVYAGLGISASCSLSYRPSC